MKHLTNENSHKSTDCHTDVVNVDYGWDADENILKIQLCMSCGTECGCKNESIADYIKDICG